ncbi:MAG: hypothetical protein H6Q18_473, partial [Bacteroidetes bacterium]|nr:hypothetical protein [Bacteroidota bacterium]
KYLIQGLLLLMRKAYVIINDEKISLKPDSSTKGEMIFWKDIMTIKKSGKNFEILSTDSSAYTIHLSYYDYKTADEIEYTLTNIASEKGIIISGN